MTPSHSITSSAAVSISWDRQERRWATLGTPSLTPRVCDLLVEGIAREADGRTINELEAQRDQALIAALAARRTTRAASGER
jgi:hypothetical protein